MRFLKRGSVRSSLLWRIGDSNGTDVWFSSGIRVWWIEIGREEGAGNFGYSAPWELEKVFLLIWVELGTPPDHTTIWFLGFAIFNCVCDGSLWFVMEACDSKIPNRWVDLMGSEKNGYIHGWGIKYKYKYFLQTCLRTWHQYFTNIFIKNI